MSAAGARALRSAGGGGARRAPPHFFRLASGRRFNTDTAADFSALLEYGLRRILAAALAAFSLLASESFSLAMADARSVVEKRRRISRRHIQ